MCQPLCQRTRCGSLTTEPIRNLVSTICQRAHFSPPITKNHGPASPPYGAVYLWWACPDSNWELPPCKGRPDRPRGGIRRYATTYKRRPRFARIASYFSSSRPISFPGKDVPRGNAGEDPRADEGIDAMTKWPGLRRESRPLAFPCLTPPPHTPAASRNRSPRPPGRRDAGSGRLAYAG